MGVIGDVRRSGRREAADPDGNEAGVHEPGPGLDEGKTLLLPRCVDRNTMVALPVSDPDTLEKGILGIPEPPAAEGTEVPAPDLILVPCMCATPNGIRLGHGAGYYDRFLTGQKGMTVCLCFSRLLRSDLPAEETDIPVDLVITDEGD